MITTVFINRIYVYEDYVMQVRELCTTTVYSRLEWGGEALPARAPSNHEWRSNRIECSNSDLVHKTGLNCARKQLYARSDVRNDLGRGLPP